MAVTVEQLEGLYRQHGPELLHYLRGRPGLSRDAEDLLHETFVQAALFRERLDESASPRAWLFAVARHVASAFRRRWWHRAAEPLDAEHVAAPVERRDDGLDAMREAIERLPPIYREPLELRLRHELSYVEIADVLSLPLSTIRSRLHHAMERLRETLQATHDGVAGRDHDET